MTNETTPHTEEGPSTGGVEQQPLNASARQNEARNRYLITSVTAHLERLLFGGDIPVIPASTPPTPSVAAQDAGEWQSIHTRPNSDDPMWFYSVQHRTYSGPRGAEPYDADNFDYWAPCRRPPMPKEFK